eukprot:CAMPEP_0114660268 /NCGR_PEP_ID=MMETSP0191-20121206/19639_1 /TAXON_ID=126664 /ORGANISM="Sorites sp." /LENGTH=222 /DNA_ID=CAMNT_0001888243 /DNA_START=21 /DNA_END=689 /DNA_ORIENTATION=-
MPTLKHIYVERRTNTELRNALEILERFGRTIRRTIKIKCEWCKGTTPAEQLLAELQGGNVGIVSINDNNFPHYNYLRGHHINFVREASSGRTHLTCGKSTRQILDDHTEPSDWEATARDGSYYSASGGNGTGSASGGNSTDSAEETEEDIDIKDDSTALGNANIKAASQNNKGSPNDDAPVILTGFGNAKEAPKMDEEINTPPDPTKANILQNMEIDAFLNE